MWDVTDCVMWAMMGLVGYPVVRATSEFVERHHRDHS